jgi:hypothetical protein
LKKTAHIIYPVNKDININPWSIGNNIIYALKDNFNIKVYQWTSLERIIPSKGDILIGHSNSNPFTVFRRSMNHQNWSKIILLQPYNEDLLQMSYLYDVVDKCDYFLALCGDYWFDRVSSSPFKKWNNKIIQLKLGIQKNLYPFQKKKFNVKGKRKFLYIGNDYAYNNFAKNLPYLNEISKAVGSEFFGTVGNKRIGNIKHYRWLNFQKKSSLNVIKNFDFLIQTSTHDANPSTVLEAISWGLIPVVTKECGYSNDKSIINIPLNKIKDVKKIILNLQFCEEKKLNNMQINNLSLLKKKYNWKNFRKIVFNTVVLRKRNLNTIKYSKKESAYFKKNTRESLNYFLRPYMIYIVLKANISLFLKKIFFFKKNINI